MFKNKTLLFAFILLAELSGAGRHVVALEFSKETKSTQETELRVLTLNAWMLSILGYHVSKDMKVRAKLLPQMVAATGADIIALQEVWPDRYKRWLKEEFQKLGYVDFFHTKRYITVGNGLAIISKFPIRDTKVAPTYELHTRGDEKFAKKRAIYAEIELPGGEKIDFFTTHTGALTYDKKKGTYNAHQKKRQLRQYMELKSWIRKTRKNARVILAADLNAGYLKLESGDFLPEYDADYLKLIDDGCGKDKNKNRERQNFTNTYLTANHMNELSKQVPTFSTENPYVANGKFGKAPSETEDYILSCGFDASEIVTSDVIFRDPIPPEFVTEWCPEHIPLRLSDHYGVTTLFRLIM